MAFDWNRSFISEDDLRNAIGPNTYLQIFNDDRNGKANPDAVLLVLRRAHGEVMSYLPGIYPTLPAEGPGQAADLMAISELDYAVAMALERHPEFVRSFGKDEREKRFARADARMLRIIAGIQRIAPKEQASPALQVPANQGGVIVQTGPKTTLDPDDLNGGGSGDF